MPGHAPLLPTLALLLNALVWGLSWWPFRQLERLGLHPLWATAMVYLLSLACLLAWRPGAWRGWSRQPLLWLLMLATGLSNVGFNWAVTVGDVVRVVLLFYLMPAWSILLAWWLLGERPTRAALGRLALALSGVLIVLKAPDSAWPWPETAADFLALLGGFSFALTNVLLRRLHRTPEASRALAMFGGGAGMASAVALLGLTLGRGGVTPLPAPSADWLVLGGLLSLAFLAGNLALQYGAARLRAHATALIMLSEVVFASLSSVLLGAAELSARTLAGGALVILAAALSAWPTRVERSALAGS
ncbi:DMT family transporter [Ramlibacter sp. 2FC]|uniref:DMT family transporter n=1 Tax=Ramlibacter sp. 2FC TaxID=2502188 RepID=UPI0010F52654|nr:DMT family transporter [Ramlibacter sp. 2FC]